MSYQTNENGELLLNIEDALKEAIGESTFEGFTRYNGGWIKQVVGLDKSKTDGYSIIGDFAQKKKTWVKPGLYLDCSIAGSRKNQDRRFHLFILHNDGSIETIGKEREYRGSSGGDWAVDAWEDIEKTLSKPNFTGSEKSRLDTLKEVRMNLLKQLELIQAEIKTLEENK